MFLCLIPPAKLQKKRRMTASLCDYLFTNHENGIKAKENVTQNKEILPFIRPICRKDNANERNESLLSNCRVQLILCKDTHILQKSLYLVFGRCYHYRRFIPFFVLKNFNHILVATHELATFIQHTCIDETAFLHDSS